MSDVMTRTRAGVARILRRFPCETATLYRTPRDAYEQATSAAVQVGSTRVYPMPAERPNGEKGSSAAVVYDDSGDTWVSMLWTADLPEARHGDEVRFSDGRVRYVRNVQNRGNVRVLWQLSETPV